MIGGRGRLVRNWIAAPEEPVIRVPGGGDVQDVLMSPGARVTATSSAAATAHLPMHQFQVVRKFDAIRPNPDVHPPPLATVSQRIVKAPPACALEALVAKLPGEPGPVAARRMAAPNPRTIDLYRASRWGTISSHEDSNGGPLHRMKSHEEVPRPIAIGTLVVGCESPRSTRSMLSSEYRRRRKNSSASQNTQPASCSKAQPLASLNTSLYRPTQSESEAFDSGTRASDKMLDSGFELPQREATIPTVSRIDFDDDSPERNTSPPHQLTTDASLYYDSGTRALLSDEEMLFDSTSSLSAPPDWRIRGSPRVEVLDPNCRVQLISESAPRQPAPTEPVKRREAVTACVFRRRANTPTSMKTSPRQR